MKRLATLFTQSFEEIQKPRTITVCAMFAALAVVLGYFTIALGDYIKIGFSGIPNVLVGCLFGPVAVGCFGGLLDLLKYIVKPTGAFFPGFTLNAILGGMIYGCAYYRKSITLFRVLVTKLVVILICNVLLNTLWLSMLYGQAFAVLLPVRLMKNLIMWPVDSLIFFTIARTFEVAGIFRMIRGRAA